MSDVDAPDEPVVAVGVAPAQVARGQPCVAGFEHRPQRVVRVAAVAVAEPCEQHAHLAGSTPPGEAVGSLDEPAACDVVAGDVDVSAAGERAAERPDLAR